MKIESFTAERSQYENDSSSVVACGTESSTNKPFIGQEFENEETVKRFYNIYAYKIDFSIKKSYPLQRKKKKKI